MSWAGMISAGVGPWVKQALGGIGVGLISYVGLSQITGQLESAAASAWSGLSGDIYQLAALAGLVTGVNIWLAAISAAVAILSFKRLGVLSA